MMTCLKTISLKAGVLLALAFLISCSAEKRIERKDNAAVERVRAKKSLLDKVKPQLDTLYPCKIDTNPKFLPGRVDSVPYPVLVPLFPDSSAIKKLKDSIAKLKIDSARAEDMFASGYAKGYNVAANLFSNLKVPVKAPDTLLNTVIDRKDLNSCRGENENLKQQLSAEKKLNQSILDDKNTYLMWLIIVSSLFVSSIVLNVYLKVRKVI